MKNVIFYDLREGLGRRWYRYAVFFAVVIITCMHADGMVFNDIRTREYEAGFLNYVIYMFQGIKPFEYSTDDRQEIPAFWLLFNIYILFVLGGYVSDSLKENRNQCFVRYGSRIKFMISKYVYMFVGTVIYHAVTHLAVMCHMAVKGRLTFYEPDTAGVINAINPEEFPSESYAFMVILLLPFLASCAYMTVCMTAEVCGHQWMGMIFICAYIAAGAYIPKEAFISNSTMLCRNENFLSGGTELLMMITYVIIILGISTAAGIAKIKHFEYIKGAEHT